MLREAASAWSGAKLREVEAASVWSGCRESATTACGPKTETSHTTDSRYEEIISVQTFKHSKLDPLMFRSVLVEDRSGTFTSATSIGLHCLHLRQRNRKETCTLTNIGYVI